VYITYFVYFISFGDKVEFNMVDNTVDFVESRPCIYNFIHCLALAPNTLATKTTVSASKLNYTATVDFVAVLLPVSATVDFQQSRPCWINFVASVYRALDEQLSSVHLRDNCSSRRSRTQLIRTKYRWHDGRFDTGNMACFCRCECRLQINSIAADWCSSKSRTAV